MPLVRDKSSDDADSKVLDVDFPMLLPHSVFSLMYNEFPGMFGDMFLGGKDRSFLAGFWKELDSRGDPRLAAHPMREVENWEYNNVPLMIHGDAIPCLGVGKSNSKSFDVYSMQGLLSIGPLVLLKLVLFGLFDKSKVDGGCGASMKAIWRRLLWSFHVLQLGKHPTCDDNGVPYAEGTPEYERSRANGGWLAGGLRAVIYLLKGDIEHFSKGFGLPTASSNSPCLWCPANRSVDEVPMRYNNSRRDARWKRLIWTASEWRALGWAKHWLF